VTLLQTAPLPPAGLHRRSEIAFSTSPATLSSFVAARLELSRPEWLEIAARLRINAQHSSFKHWELCRNDGR
jgi:hypothetical protein